MPAPLQPPIDYTPELVLALSRADAALSELSGLGRELHERLMKGVRGNRATPGEFTRSQNWIGPAGSTSATAT